MAPIALIFPGQGSHSVGMGREIFDSFEAARKTFEEASDAVGFDLAELCFEGPKEKLDLTLFTQPCLLAASVAAYNVLQNEIGITPVAAAGHSLGEYSALVAAGSIILSDAVVAVHKRGKWMEEAVPEGKGAMAAVLGGDPEAIEDACEEASDDDEVVVPANDNAPGQIVMSGHTKAVDRAVSILKEKKVRSKKLSVSGPFHSPLMAPAAIRMAEHLDGLTIKDPAFPVIANVTAQAYENAGQVPELLVSQLTRPVRWRETVTEIDRRGATLYIEVGPGKVLSGLVKRTLGEATVLPMMVPEDLDAIREAVNG